MPEWYYLDGGLWTPFDATISTELETIFQKDSTGKFADFTVDFHAMALTRRNKRNKILIKRANMAGNPSHAWEWEMNGQWHPYDFFDSDFLCLVESAPHLQTTVLYLGPQNVPYQIDTNSCTQKNMKTSYRRPIRKVPLTPPPPPPAAAPAPAPSIPTPATVPTASSAPSATASLPLPSSSSSGTPSSGASSAAVAVSSLDLTGVSPVVHGVMVACIKFDCNEDCVICMEPFDDVNGLAYSLPDCLNHGFHLECIKNQLMSQGKCPICNKIYIINEGTQPRNGTMTVRTHGRSLPGYPRCGTIEMFVTYLSSGSLSTEITISQAELKGLNTLTLGQDILEQVAQHTFLIMRRDRRCWNCSKDVLTED